MKIDKIGVKIAVGVGSLVALIIAIHSVTYVFANNTVQDGADENKEESVESAVEYLADVRIYTSDIEYERLITACDEYIDTCDDSEWHEISVGSIDKEGSWDDSSLSDESVEERIMVQETFLHNCVLVTYMQGNKISNVVAGFTDSSHKEISVSNIQKVGDTTYDVALKDNNEKYLIYIITGLLGSLAGSDSDISDDFANVADNIKIIKELIGEGYGITAGFANLGFSRKDIKVVDRVFVQLNYFESGQSERSIFVLLKLNGNGIIYDLDILK